MPWSAYTTEQTTVLAYESVNKPYAWCVVMCACVCQELMLLPFLSVISQCEWPSDGDQQISNSMLSTGIPAHHTHTAHRQTDDASGERGGQERGDAQTCVCVSVGLCACSCVHRYASGSIAEWCELNYARACRCTPAYIHVWLTVASFLCTCWCVWRQVVSDRVGRRPTVLLWTVCVGVFGLLSAFTTSLMQLCCCRVMVGIGVGGQSQ